MHHRVRGEDGFSLIEMVIATVILGIISVMLVQMIRNYTKYAVRAAIRGRRRLAELDLRRLAVLVTARGTKEGMASPLGPLPIPMPLRDPLPWPHPAPGFDEIGWAPSASPVHLQYRVDPTASAFTVSAIGDLDHDGSLEQYRINELGTFEGPLPYPPETVAPISP